MRSILSLGALLIFIITFTCPVMAQEIELTPQMKEWEPVLGKWSGTSEYRESPSGTWIKESLEWEYQSRGFCLENRWKSKGEEDYSMIEIIGYDPVKKCYVDIGFRDDGSWISITSMGWSGATLNLNLTDTSVNGKVSVSRCSWEYSPNFKSARVIAEDFTNGKWWTSWKMEATKIE